MQGMCKVLTGEFGPRQNITVGYLSEMVHLPLTVPLEVRVRASHQPQQQQGWYHAGRWRGQESRSSWVADDQALRGLLLWCCCGSACQVVITRIITSKGRIKSLRQAFDEIVAERGLLGFYKGIGAYVSSQQTFTLSMFDDMGHA